LSYARAGNSGNGEFKGRGAAGQDATQDTAPPPRALLSARSWSLTPTTVSVIVNRAHSDTRELSSKYARFRWSAGTLTDHG